MPNNPTVVETISDLRGDLAEAGFTDDQAFALIHASLPFLLSGQVQAGDVSPSLRDKHEQLMREYAKAANERALRDDAAAARLELPQQIHEAGEAIQAMLARLEKLDARITSSIRRGGNGDAKADRS